MSAALWIVSLAESVANAESVAAGDAVENESGTAAVAGVTESAMPARLDAGTRRALVSDNAWNAGATTTVGG